MFGKNYNILYKSGSWVALALIFFLPISTALSNVCLGFLAVVGILQGFPFKIKNWQNPLVYSLGLLFLLHIIALSYSSASWGEQQSILLDALKCFVPLFLIPYFKDQRQVDLAIKIFLAAMGLMFFVACLKYFGGFNIGSERFSRAAVFKDHITSGFLMSFAAFIVATKLLNISRSSWQFCAGILALILMVFYIFFMNIGRTGHVLFIILAFLWVWQHRQSKKIIRTICILTLLIGLVYSSSTHFLKPQADQSLLLRNEFVYTSLELVTAKPWFGFGTGGFISAYKNYADKAGLSPTNNPHNQYLMFAVEFGLLGLIFIASLFVNISRSLKGLNSSAAIMGQGLLVALLVGCALNSWFQDFTEGYFFITMLSIMFGMYNTYAKNFKA